MHAVFALLFALPVRYEGDIGHALGHRAQCAVLHALDGADKDGG